MAEPSKRNLQRREPLSRARIVEAAVQLLDEEAGDADAPPLTLRALMTRLSTGSGAVYHHVANMDELRAAAADAVLRPRLEVAADPQDGRDSLRAASAAVFSAIVEHGWLAPQLSRQPLQPAVVLIWTTIGRCMAQLQVGPVIASNAGSTLVSFILGAAMQYASGPGQASDAGQRAAKLGRLAAELVELYPDQTTSSIAAQLRDHDDQVQFLAGIDLIVDGALLAAQKA